MGGLVHHKTDVSSLPTRGGWARSSFMCTMDFIEVGGEARKASHHYFVYSHWMHEIIKGNLHNH